MILNKEDALYAANVFTEFFANFDRIDDYMRTIKLERMGRTDFNSLPGFGPEEDIFNKFDMHPRDMEFSVYQPTQSEFMQFMEITTSAPCESSIPGKQLCWMVREKNTGMVVGMIRFGSPTINSRPRNLWLGKPLDTLNPDVMKRFNQSVIMGFNIVPTQPFGFNYLGGKLLAAICCSHYSRDAVNKKYDANICMFETTSLYGSTKATSQYDGMKPFLRHNGLTDSNFAPLINDDKYLRLMAFFTERNDGVPIIDPQASSKKLKAQTKMVGIIKNSLKSIDESAYKKFCESFSNAKALTEQKRSFYSTYGYENVQQYLNLETDTLVKKENYDRFSLEGVIEWWRNKASTRYETLKNDNRLRTEVESWNVNAEKIDIIR